MNALRWMALLLLLGLLQVFLPRVWLPLGIVDWLLIAVVHRALRASFRDALLMGAAAGLIQDGLSGGIVGLHAFSKTVVAAVISSFGGFLVVRGPVPQALVTGLAGLLENAIVVGWQVLLLRPASLGPVDIPIRGLATGIATVLVFVAAQRLQQRFVDKGRQPARRRVRP